MKKIKQLDQIKKKSLEAWAIAMEALGFKTRLFQKTENLNEPLLQIILPQEGQNKRQELAVGFMPSEKGNELHHLSLVQVFSAAPFILDEASFGQLLPLLPAINNIQPLGHFSFGKDGQLFYRYNLATPLDPWDDSEALQQMFLLIIGQLDHQYPLLEAFCKQTISKDEFFSLL